MLDELIRRGQAVTLIHRVLCDEELVLGDELDEYATDGKAVVVNVVGDHCGVDGAWLLSGEHLRELIPDIDKRDVFVCGPPPMISHVRASLASLGIPARQIHVERFAFAVNLR